MTSRASGGTNSQEKLRTGIAPVSIIINNNGQNDVISDSSGLSASGRCRDELSCSGSVWGLGFSETQLAPDVWRRIRFCPCYNRRRSSRATGLFLTSISLVGGIVERAKLPESRGSKSNGASWPFQVAESMGFRANFANGSTY
jgi:hypothetical protein